MHRRSFLAGLVSAVAGSLEAGAQPAEKVYRIGYLSSTRPWDQIGFAAFKQGLRDLGYVEGQNIVIEYRWAEGKYERLPGLAKDLVRINLDLIVSAGGPAAARAVKAATTTIPVIFSTASAVDDGIVSNIARPGGNLTGVAVFAADLDAKRLELLKEALPRLERVAVLWNPGTLARGSQRRRLEVAAQALTVRLRFVEVRVPGEIDNAFAAMRRERTDALLVASDPMLSSQRQRIVDLAGKSGVPTAYEWRQFVEAGGLMSFGTNITERYRRLATYVDRILKGVKPGDLPVEQPTKFELVINLKTARTLGLAIPQSLLLRADQVIE